MDNAIRLIPPIELGGEVGINLEYGCFVFNVDFSQFKDQKIWNEVFKLGNKVFFGGKMFIVDRAIFYPEEKEKGIKPFYALFVSDLPYNGNAGTELVSASVLIKAGDIGYLLPNNQSEAGEADVIKFKRSA